MKIIIDIPDATIKQVVKSIMENFPEASHGNSLRCIDWEYEEMKFQFVDTEEKNKRHEITEEKLIAAFPLLFTDKWPKGCTKPPMSGEMDAWDNWLCQADATDFDAFVQLALLGEVIYG